ncbi:MAG: serine/threonine-protein phosphatase, partial [Lactobacillaceae bacterium]|nr:serine/threonine-protein phosphatase [Lactobacillaceae bacterium]
HSLGKELLASGVITEDQVDKVPKGNAITRYFGSRGEVELDFNQIEVSNGDILMLATDGLNKEVDEGKINQILNDSNISLGEMSAKLINLANELSGFDNVTVLLMSQFSEED